MLNVLRYFHEFHRFIHEKYLFLIRISKDLNISFNLMCCPFVTRPGAVLARELAVRRRCSAVPRISQRQVAPGALPVLG